MSPPVDLAALLVCAVAIAGVLAGTHRALRRLDPRPPVAHRHPLEAAWASLWLLPARCAIRAWLAVAVVVVMCGGAAGAATALWWLP